MKKASIVSVGNEILSGQTVDTNAAYLGSKLLSIGIPVVSCYTVGDQIDLIVRGLDLAGQDADIVLVTGGLGPTGDDLTRQAFAEFLGVELQLRAELLEGIEGFFSVRKVPMPETNKIQACIPAGAIALENNIGTAPGFIVCKNDKLFFVMPGVPVEMIQMFERSVLSKLGEFASGQVVVERKLKCFGTGESKIAELLGDLFGRGRNPLINCTVRTGVITVHIIARAEDEDGAQEMAGKDEKLIEGLLGELVYGRGEQTLGEVVGEELGRQKKTIAVAESCTGGWLGKLLTDTPGASKYFTHGWVTYSDSAKISELGVGADLIEKHGAVSEQVAVAMAQGGREKAGANYAIGITGIAGPTGASERKPLGLVYIAVDCDAGCEVKRCVLSHDRGSIRLRAALTALNMLRLKLGN
jgi:nicotinamide-nucleotide amidase